MLDATEGNSSVVQWGPIEVTIMLPKISFSPERSPSEEAINEAEALFREQGTLFLQGAFDRCLIEKVSAACAQRYQSLSGKELRKRDAMVGERRYMVTVDIKKPFSSPALYANSNLMPLLERLLSPHLRIVSFGIVVALPGAENQAIHLDHPPLFGLQESVNELPVWATTLVVPLVELNDEIGPTAIWPRTHTSPDRIERLEQLMATPDYSLAERPNTQLGDAYLMDYRLIHGGLANLSQQVRPILYLVYGRPWFRDGFNFSAQAAFSISKKQRKKVPKRWQGLFRN